MDNLKPNNFLLSSLLSTYHQENVLKNEAWEPELIKTLVLSIQKEQRSERRFILLIRLMRTIGFIGMLIVSIFLIQKADTLPWETKKGQQPHSAIVSIKGAIMPEGPNSADRFIPTLQEAFKNEAAKAILISINSPGGSPVQASRIYDEILNLKTQYPDKPVYAIIDDLGASGGYYVAIAADKIYANRASLVGSIGVISSSFGFVDLLDKVGIERRTFTAGNNKNFMDPFLPLSPGAQSFWDTILDQTHQQFISVVKQQRGEKLDSNNTEIFSGLVWSGEQALSLGLIDELGSIETVARLVDEKGTSIDYSPTEDVLRRLATRFTAQIKNSLTDYFGFQY